MSKKPKNTTPNQNVIPIEDKRAEQEALREMSIRELAMKVRSKLGGIEGLMWARKDRLWKWDGIWKRLGDREIKRTIQNVVHDENLGMNKKAAILDWFRNIVVDHEDLELNPQALRVNCLNGELEWKSGCWILGSHKPESYSTIQIPVEYDPVAKAPKFVQTLDECFQYDSDAEDRKRVLLEMTGYSLTTSPEYEKFIILVGPGANGKSVYIKTLVALVGKDNTAAIQPTQHENRYQRSYMLDKLINVVTEIPVGHVLPDGFIKSIVTGEDMMAEEKYKKAFRFTPFATWWLATNHMPHTRDSSEAFFRRAIVLPFNRVFTIEEQDTRLHKKLAEELPGILNLALDAFGGVIERGEFTEPKSCIMAKEEWMLECDYLAQFVNDCFDHGDDLKASSKEYYPVFVWWSKENGVRGKGRLGKNQLSTALRKAGYPKRTDNAARGVKYIDLKPKYKELAQNSLMRKYM